MALDSSASFAERVTELGLDAHAARFTAAGWSTFADFAFTSSYTPGGEEALFIDEVVTVGLGTPDHADKRKLRRLYFESYTMAAADLKRRVDSGTDDMPRSIPNAEREERRSRLALRLVGLELTGELDVSDRLIDRCITMYESNSLVYLGPDVCTKRSTGVLGGKSDRLWEAVPSASGAMVFKRLEDDSLAETGSQFALQFALQRRALALDMADIVAYEITAKLNTLLVAAHMKQPPRGFAAVSISQMLEADQTAWTLVADQTRKGIKRTGAGRPCDAALTAVFKEHEFSMALMPRLYGLGSSSAAAAAGAPSPFVQPSAHPVRQPQPKNASRNAAKKRRDVERKVREKSAAQPSASAAGAAPAKRQINMPKALIGMATISSKATGNKRLCFGFNLGSCKDASPGQACGKGLHGCMKPTGSGEACSEAHPVSSCKR